MFWKMGPKEISKETMTFILKYQKKNVNYSQLSEINVKYKKLIASNYARTFATALPPQEN